jgi:hypothetical protein
MLIYLSYDLNKVLLSSFFYECSFKVISSVFRTYVLYLMALVTSKDLWN